VYLDAVWLEFLSFLEEEYGAIKLFLCRVGNIRSIADRVESTDHALTADDLAKQLSVSRITIFKQAKAGRIPSFRVGTCVRSTQGPLPIGYDPSNAT